MTSLAIPFCFTIAASRPAHFVSDTFKYISGHPFIFLTSSPSSPEHPDTSISISYMFLKETIVITLMTSYQSH